MFENLELKNFHQFIFKFIIKKRMLRNVLAGIIFIGLFISGCNNGESNKDEKVSLESTKSVAPKYFDSLVYSSDNLVIRKISKHVYEHTSFLQTESFGKVPCNGMVVADKKEAIVFDTPTDSLSSEELIHYFTSNLYFKIKAVVPTHFHADCLGGLKEFHQHQIPSFASDNTIRILKEKMDNSPIPENGFADSLALKVGDKKVFAGSFGEGHTKDNIVGFFAAENILFGGCLIKESGAGKGNLEDANVAAWPETVKKIQQRFPQVGIVIPGHGKRGGAELFDYTIRLFSLKP